MSAQHTPGPWSINNWPQASADIAIGATGTPVIARVPLRDVSINEQKANARLIAAAPDLLAALQTLIPHILHYATLPHAHSAAYQDAAEALAATTQATGEQA